MPLAFYLMGQCYAAAGMRTESEAAIAALKARPYVSTAFLCQRPGLRIALPRGRRPRKHTGVRDRIAASTHY